MKQVGILKKCGSVALLLGRPLVVVAFACALPAFSMDRVSGANATLDIEPGARSAALGSATMAIDGDYLGLMSNPYQLSGAKYTWASFSHTAYYEDTKYDYASVVTPLGDGHALGVSISRYGADDIPWIKEGESLPEGSNYNTLSIADWVLGISWGRSITSKLSVGAAFNLLYRDMDQTGWGFRGDAGLRYRLVDQFYLASFLKGWTSSAVTWESGTTEYSSPELYLAASYFLNVPYLYGSLGLYWQGAGIFRHEARDYELETEEGRGDPLWKDPLDWLSGGRAGLEFLFDFGLSLRLGMSSFTSFQSVTAGAGLVIAKFLKIDYAFASHPVLSAVHRVSVSVSPYLFGHNDPEARPHLSPDVAARKPLLENEVDDEAPLEDPSSEPAKPNEDRKDSSSAASTSPASPTQSAPADASPKSAPGTDPKAAPADQNGPQTAPAPEAIPSGGMFWEE